MAPGLGDKRRRSSDSVAQTELPRNQLVASFLYPSGLGGGLPSPAIRRRVDVDRDVASDRPAHRQRMNAPGPVGAEDMTRHPSGESVASSDTLPSIASTAPTSIGTYESTGEPDNTVKEILASVSLNTPREECSQEERNAADILASAPAGVHDPQRAMSRLIAPDLDVETPRAEAPAPQFAVRSSDPFSYMSSSKSSAGADGAAAAPRPQQGSYFQSGYARAGAGTGPIGSSSRATSSEVSPPVASPFLGNSPSSMFLSRVIAFTCLSSILVNFSLILFSLFLIE